MPNKASDIIAQMKGVLPKGMGPAGPDEQQDYDEEDKVDFAIPEGYQLPSGVKAGDEFTAVGTFKLDEDGDLCLTKLEGIPVKAESEVNPEPYTSPPATGIATQNPSPF
jgi:hypothetical protein